MHNIKKLFIMPLMLLVSMSGMSQQTGKATHYAKYMHNHKTASGSRLNNYGYECAHKKHPFGTMLRVRNLNNNKEVVVKVVDRGPYAKGIIIDLTWQAAKDLGMIGHGVAPVIITVEGKDDTSSTTDGGSDITPLNQWTAGATTTIEAINAFGGLDKCFEAEDAVNNGADEIDMVINIGWVKDKRYDDILSEINAVKKSCGGRLLKVIIETCLLTDEEKIRMCGVVSDSDADYIKTSTGFSTGGATKDDIRLFAQHMKNGKKIKAAGGIASIGDAAEFIALGAERLGTSRIVKLIKGAGEDGSY